jgi:ribonuclease Z
MQSCLNAPKCIVHQLGTGVIKDPKYQAFINKLPTKQIILAKEINNNETVFYNSAELLEKLTEVDDMFKINRKNTKNVEATNFETTTVETTSVESTSVETTSITEVAVSFGKNVHFGTNQTEFTIDPKQNLQEVLKIPTKSLLVPGFLDALILEKSKYRNPKLYTEIPQVITLGTGSCMPSKYRNVTSNFIKLPKANMFLDIGEGSTNQLFYHFGNQFNLELVKTRFIFISHLHADHHLGTFGIIQSWMKLSNGLKLYLAAPRPFWKWVIEYSEIEDIGLDGW